MPLVGRFTIRQPDTAALQVQNQQSKHKIFPRCHHWQQSWPLWSQLSSWSWKPSTSQRAFASDLTCRNSKDPQITEVFQTEVDEKCAALFVLDSDVNTFANSLKDTPETCRCIRSTSFPYWVTCGELTEGQYAYVFCTATQLCLSPPSSSMAVIHGPCLLTLKRRVQAFETKCRRKFLWSSYLERKTNDWVQNKTNFFMSPQEPPLPTVGRWKLAWF